MQQQPEQGQNGSDLRGSINGIPYETEDGIADFHASGRHTHITELLRNGATLPEVQKLARHLDIKMTMKYVHIGIADQAKAVANLPASALQFRRRRGAIRVTGWQDTIAKKQCPASGL